MSCLFSQGMQAPSMPSSGSMIERIFSVTPPTARMMSPVREPVTPKRWLTGCLMKSDISAMSMATEALSPSTPPWAWMYSTCIS